jgi:uncharacterized protein
MTTVLVVSDTHGNSRLLGEALRHHPSAEVVIHLGDFTEDLEKYAELLSGKRIYAAPGRYDREYEYGRLPLLCRTTIEGWRLIMAHERRNAPRDWLDGADMVFYGHTHAPAYEREGRVAWVNPGHLKDDYDRGASASCLIGEFSREKVVFTWRSPDGIPYREETHRY